MRKITAAMNMTVDGFCDHTLGIADDELAKGIKMGKDPGKGE